MLRSGTSAPKRPPCVEIAVSRLGRTFRISTTSVSPGSAPSMAIGPTSPGHAPPAFSYHSPQSDSLAILDAGAYFVPYQTNFSFPRPAIVMLERGRARLLRRAERFTDLVAFDS